MTNPSAFQLSFRAFRAPWIVTALVCLPGLTMHLRAQVPQLINYQGRVTVGSVNFDGTGQFRFALVDANGTTTYWSNDGTSIAGSQPTQAVPLPVSKGLYSVLLGDATLPNMTVVPATVFTRSDVRLRVWFNDGTNGSQLLTPDQRLAAVGYAMLAAGVPDGAITANQLAPGAVGSPQIASGAVTATHIANGGIGAAQLAAAAVTAGHIGAGQVVKSLNGLSDSVTLTAGANLTLTATGNTVTLAAPLTGGTATLDDLTVGGSVHIPDVPLFVACNHTNASGINALVFSRSRDGISFTPIGSAVPFVAATGVRDPSMFYYAPTGEWIIAYTKSMTTTTFDTEIGLCKTRDFIHVTALPDITLPGVSPAFTWNGSFFVNEGNYYLLMLPLGPGGNKNANGIGWIKCTNPGTWTSWTNFVSLKATNANWAAASGLNDPHITKVGSTYHLYCDGNDGSHDGILHATSASPLTGYSALAAIASLNAREGAIFTTSPTGSYRLYSEVVYGPLTYSDSADLVTWSTPAEINWPGRLALGNGEVVRVGSLAAQASVFAAPSVDLGLVDSGDYGQLAFRTSATSLDIRLRADLTGNGNSGGDLSFLYINATADNPVSRSMTISGTYVAPYGIKITGNSDFGYGLSVTPPVGAATALLARPSNSNDALYISSPFGPISATNPQWSWGLAHGSADFSINRYDTAAHTDLAIGVNGNVTIAALLAAKNVALNHSALTFGASTAVDFSGDGFQTVTLAGNLIFTSSNLAAGRSKTIRIVGDANPRTLAFPVGWRFVGSAAPSSLAANRIALLTLTSFSTTDAHVVARYSAEP